jgi:branched-chain amino acid transport system ATP-binding protein
MDELLAIRGLSARYGQVEVLRDVSLGVGPGEVVGVVGPNGAGKTTLLRSLSGLVRGADGSARLAGAELMGLRPHRVARAGFAHVPEGCGTIATLTVEENLLLGGVRLSARDAGRRVAEMYEVFPVLGRLRHNRAGLLSGGEQQMLAVARGLMTRPLVLALDEPSMGLAPVIIKDLIEMLRSALASGVAILLIEQNSALAAELASRLYVLVRGTIRAQTDGGALPAGLMDAYTT